MRGKASFIKPMLLLRSEMLPSDEGQWEYQLKLDGYRAVAFKTSGKVHLRSRNDNDFGSRYSQVLRGLAGMPPDTIIDGEVVALNSTGRPSFGLLQNYVSGDVSIVFFIFDVMMIRGRDLTGQSLLARREVLEQKILPTLRDPVRYAAPLDAPLASLVHAVRTQGFEGLVAKRRDSSYEPGLRTGAWMKMRVNQGQEFVIGGYTIGSKSFDALIFGYYDDAGRLIYAARTRNGFTPASRAQLTKRFRGLESTGCPFANLPEAKSGRWGQGLTKAKMADCRWLKPELVGQFEFLEWTGENHLRHTRFVALREDKRARDVRREAPPSTER
jgi:DNA ligase D-like protein (predicted ligase)